MSSTRAWQQSLVKSLVSLRGRTLRDAAAFFVLNFLKSIFDNHTISVLASRLEKQVPRLLTAGNTGRKAMFDLNLGHVGVYTVYGLLFTFWGMFLQSKTPEEKYKKEMRRVLLDTKGYFTEDKKFSLALTFQDMQTGEISFSLVDIDRYGKDVLAAACFTLQKMIGGNRPIKQNGDILSGLTESLICAARSQYPLPNIRDLRGRIRFAHDFCTHLHKHSPRMAEVLFQEVRTKV